ncbi:MAG: beta-galactosidase trimerization domain-containing protein, partial [Clostridia bacterium]|nr:beta-galactosidase trimerization domain-containing protein [Clostridia bacterium]
VMEHENSVIYKGEEYPVKSVAELIIPSTAETLACFTDNIQKDKPAVLKNSYGKGTAYYVGYNADSSFMDLFMKDVMTRLGIEAVTDVTSDNKAVRVTCREGDGERYIFVLNLSREEQNIKINGTFTDLLTGETASGENKIAPLGVMVLK